MNQKRLEAIDNENKAKGAFKEEEFEISSKHLEIMTEMLSRAPRSTVINFGVTPEAVHFIDKAETVVNKLHEMAFGQAQANHQRDDVLLKVFRSLEGKLTELAYKVEALDRNHQKIEQKVNGEDTGGCDGIGQPVKQNILKEAVTKPKVKETLTRGKALHFWKDEEIKAIRDLMEEKGKLTAVDFRDLEAQLNISRSKISAKYYELAKRKGE